MTTFNNITSIELTVRETETDIEIFKIKDELGRALNTFLTLALSAVHSDFVDLTLGTLYDVVEEFNKYNNTFLPYNCCRFYNGTFEIELTVFKKSRNNRLRLELKRLFEPFEYFELDLTEA